MTVRTIVEAAPRIEQAEARPSRARALQRAQALSGAFFALFLLLHAVNTLVGIAGIERYDQAQAWLRRLYQAPGVELLLALALLVHVGSGITLARLRGRGPAGGRPRRRFSRVSGYVLLAVVPLHAFATRGSELLWDLPTGGSIVAYSLEWVPLYFYPYYVALFTIGSLHGLLGVRAILARLGTGPTGRTANVTRLPLRWLTLGLALLAALSLLGLAGALGSSPLQPEQRALYRAHFDRLLP